MTRRYQHAVQPFGNDYCQPLERRLLLSAAEPVLEPAVDYSTLGRTIEVSWQGRATKVMSGVWAILLERGASVGDLFPEALDAVDASARFRRQLEGLSLGIRIGGAFGTGDMLRIAVPTTLSPDLVEGALERVPGIVVAEPALIYETFATPNDFGNRWELNDPDTAGNRGIDVEDAWDTVQGFPAYNNAGPVAGTQGQEGVVVADASGRDDRRRDEQ